MIAAVTEQAVCPACAPHAGHAPKGCADCDCSVESRLGQSEFVIQDLNRTYFRYRVGVGPRFGGTRANAQRFKTGQQVAREMGQWPIAAVLGCKIESMSIGSLTSRASPFLKWAGGKRQLLPELRHTYPDEQVRRYFEPFVGGGAVFFDLRARGWLGGAMLGDSNGALIRTYRGVRDDVEEVIARLKKTKYDRTFYLRWRARSLEHMKSHAEVAAWVIYLNRTGFNGLWRVNSSGQFNVPFGRYTNPTICDEETLRAASKALSRSHLLIGDFERTVRDAKHGDFVYFDPPYSPVSETADFTSYTADRFGLADQERLRDCALGLKKRGVHVVLSNADVPAVRKLYARGFSIRQVAARRNINSKATARGAVGELIIT